MITLHGYWRSSASYRVRIALNVKQVPYRQVTHDLRRGEQNDAAYTALNPQGLVPSLLTDDGILIQSPAILEWMEETYPAPRLLPQTPVGRAVVRGMVAAICCDIHPLHNLRVLNAVRRLGDEAAVDAWRADWITRGLAALEVLVGRHGGCFAYGDSLTLADCCLVPQIYAAERVGVGLAPYPRLAAAAAMAAEHPSVAASHPARQPDADPG
jgi:maleylpyruvate isomerase